jgi:hypothetical protein
MKCEHVKKLEKFLGKESLDVYSEHGELPDGWVNVYCDRCETTFQVRLRPKGKKK